MFVFFRYIKNRVRKFKKIFCKAFYKYIFIIFMINFTLSFLMKILLLKIEIFDIQYQKIRGKKVKFGGKYIKIIYNLLIKIKLKTTSPGQQKMHLLKISK